MGSAEASGSALTPFGSSVPGAWVRVRDRVRVRSGLG